MKISEVIAALEDVQKIAGDVETNTDCVTMRRFVDVEYENYGFSYGMSRTERSRKIRSAVEFSVPAVTTYTVQGVPDSRSGAHD